MVSVLPKALIELVALVIKQPANAIVDVPLLHVVVVIAVTDVEVAPLVRAIAASEVGLEVVHVLISCTKPMNVGVGDEAAAQIENVVSLLREIVNVTRRKHFADGRDDEFNLTRSHECVGHGSKSDGDL